MVEPVTRGDPESPLRSTCKSTRTLAKELATRRHTVSHEKVAQLLRAMDYSLQGNRKTEEGKDHPDRRETVNTFYADCPGLVQKAMDKFAQLTGRSYKLFDYIGAHDAENIIILMGSGAETAGETAQFLADKGQKVGVIKVRLYRPFSNDDLLNAIPATVKRIAVLDRTKEPGSAGEPSTWT